MKKKLFINGEWQKATAHAPLLSPYDQEIIAEIPQATEKEIDEAIISADEARLKIAKMPAHERATILENIAQLIKERFDEAAKIIATEAAKPITLAKGEVTRTIQTVM